jgi:hypothetical protein
MHNASSDGQGFTHPHGIAGTGVTSAGTGELPIGKPAPVMQGCGFGRRSFKKLVINIFFSVFVVNDNNVAAANPSLANASRGGFSF